MKSKLLDKLGVDTFPKLIPDFPALTDLFRDMRIDRDRIVSDVHRFLHTDSKKKDRVSDNQEELKILLVKEMGLVQAMPTFSQEPTAHEEFEKQLHEVKDRIKKLRQDIDRENTYSILKDTVGYLEKTESLEALDAWADEVGKWFETGALGEGSVSYNGKTYTYPKN